MIRPWGKLNQMFIFVIERKGLILKFFWAKKLCYLLEPTTQDAWLYSRTQKLIDFSEGVAKDLSRQMKWKQGHTFCQNIDLVPEPNKKLADFGYFLEFWVKSFYIAVKQLRRHRHKMNKEKPKLFDAITLFSHTIESQITIQRINYFP